MNETDAMRYANVSHDNVMVGSGPASNIQVFSEGNVPSFSFGPPLLVRPSSMFVNQTSGDPFFV